MAEALAVVGVVASIAGLMDFGSKVLHRLNDFQSSPGDSGIFYKTRKRRVVNTVRNCQLGSR